MVVVQRDIQHSGRRENIFGPSVIPLSQVVVIDTSQIQRGSLPGESLIDRSVVNLYSAHSESGSVRVSLYFFVHLYGPCGDGARNNRSEARHDECAVHWKAKVACRIPSPRLLR